MLHFHTYTQTFGIKLSSVLERSIKVREREKSNFMKYCLKENNYINFKRQ